VLFPFHIPVPVPRRLADAFVDTIIAWRIIPPRSDTSEHVEVEDENDRAAHKRLLWLSFPMNFITAPLIADLFLLAILAIGRDEVYDGTLGIDHIFPIDIMAFFLTLAYIAISIDASGLIRYLAFKVLQWGGKVGHRLFFFLYAFFFVLGSFIGNDPIILSGTAFLAYMTRVSSNIVHPRAWIHTQFAVANIASAILVSSNPTNLVIAGAFNIKFIEYTANMVVPVVVTAIVLFPFLLYIVFADPSLIPISIKMHELPAEVKAKKPVNPNIPNARGTAEEEENNAANQEQGKLLSLEEIMNPFLDKKGASFGALIMAATLITLLAINATSAADGGKPVYWVTLPAAFVMFCWDVGFGWYHRHETREIARKGREEVELARAERALREEEANRAAHEQEEIDDVPDVTEPALALTESPEAHLQSPDAALRVKPSNWNPDDETVETTYNSVKAESKQENKPKREPEKAVSTPPLDLSVSTAPPKADKPQNEQPSPVAMSTLDEKHQVTGEQASHTSQGLFDPALRGETDEEKQEMDFRERVLREAHQRHAPEPSTLVSLYAEAYLWLQETFPTVTAVVAHLPFALVPFAFCMFILVQGLVTKGWVQVFAYGWDHWVSKTGIIGSIGGMGFLSVVLCNVSELTMIAWYGILTSRSLLDSLLAPILERAFSYAESSWHG